MLVSPPTNQFACCLPSHHVGSSIVSLLMFLDDVAMDHMLPCHGPVHHPSLEGRLHRVGFGVWQKPCMSLVQTMAAFPYVTHLI
jgi:hypothetical protein